MDEVEIYGPKAIVNFDRSLELRKLIELGFLGPPVISTPPKLHGVRNDLWIYTIVLAPIHIEAGQADKVELAAKKLELGIRNMDLTKQSESDMSTGERKHQITDPEYIP